MAVRCIVPLSDVVACAAKVGSFLLFWRRRLGIMVLGDLSFLYPSDFRRAIMMVLMVVRMSFAEVSNRILCARKSPSQLERLAKVLLVDIMCTVSCA